MKIVKKADLADWAAHSRCSLIVYETCAVCGVHMYGKPFSH